MKSRAVSVVPAIAAFLVLTGCGSLKRCGTDAVVVLTAPATIPLSAVYDSLDWGEEYTSTAPTVVLAPFNIMLHGVKHTVFTVLHAVDLSLSPFYLLASITERNDLQPLSLYSLTDGYPWKSSPWPAFED